MFSKKLDGDVMTAFQVSMNPNFIPPFCDFSQIWVYLVNIYSFCDIESFKYPPEGRVIKWEPS
jgi:hypothetical protein